MKILLPYSRRRSGSFDCYYKAYRNKKKEFDKCKIAIISCCIPFPR